MNETKDRVKGGIDVAADRAKNIADQAFGSTQGVKNAAMEMAGEAKEKVQEWGSEAVDVAKHAGEKVQKWAGDALDTTTDTMKCFRNDATEMVKKYPIQSVLVGFGVGLLIGRAARS